jgi:hypothetical protein
LRVYRFAIAGPWTPQKLAQLSGMLHLPVRKLEVLVTKNPCLKDLTIADVEERICQLADGLTLPRKHALYLVHKQPTLFLTIPATVISSKAQQLAAKLDVPLIAVAKAACTVPSILMRDVDVVAKNVAQCAAILGTDPLEALHVVARAPEFLTKTPGVIRKKLAKIQSTVHQAPVRVNRMVIKEPRIVFISERILSNKVKVLMAIFNRDKGWVATS